MQFSAQPVKSQKGSQGGDSSSKGGGILRMIFRYRVVTILIGLAIVALQVIIILLIVKPEIFRPQINDDEVIAEVKQLSQTELGDSPTVLQVTNIEGLRQQNPQAKDILKDATNGDFLVGSGENLVIYRRDQGKVIYEGKSPAQITRDAQKALLDGIYDQAKQKGIQIGSPEDEQPTVSVVEDPDSYAEVDAQFYQNIRKGDFIMLYNDSRIIVIYRPETGEIVKFGDFKVEIQPR